MRKKIVRIIVTVCVMAMVASPMAVNAANTCSNISGNTGNTKTFKVHTGSVWLIGQKITLKQSKGTFRYKKAKYASGSAYTKWITEQRYGIYYVTIKDSRNRVYKGYKNVKWSGSSKSFSLGKNARYTVTVRPASLGEYSSGWQRNATKEWKRHATWWINKTRGITLCR